MRRSHGKIDGEGVIASLSVAGGVPVGGVESKEGRRLVRSHVGGRAVCCSSKSLARQAFVPSSHRCCSCVSPCCSPCVSTMPRDKVIFAQNCSGPVNRLNYNLKTTKKFPFTVIKVQHVPVFNVLKLKTRLFYLLPGTNSAEGTYFSSSCYISPRILFSYLICSVSSIPWIPPKPWGRRDTHLRSVRFLAPTPFALQDGVLCSSHPRARRPKWT